MSLTSEQIQAIEQQIITVATPYLGVILGSSTEPLIDKVRSVLQAQYQDVKVHLAYFNDTGASSVEATVDGTKISVVFTHYTV